jgi:hypothetical protein
VLYGLGLPPSIESPKITKTSHTRRQESINFNNLPYTRLAALPSRKISGLRIDDMPSFDKILPKCETFTPMLIEANGAHTESV